MNKAPTLKDLLTKLAKERGLRLVFDTHYDAGNFEVVWWRGSARHAIDVQPYPDGRVAVTALQTTYPAFPRLLAWARRSIPMFPELGRTQRKHLGSIECPCPPEQLRELIEKGLPPHA